MGPVIQWPPSPAPVAPTGLGNGAFPGLPPNMLSKPGSPSTSRSSAQRSGTYISKLWLGKARGCQGMLQLRRGVRPPLSWQKRSVLTVAHDWRRWHCSSVGLQLEHRLHTEDHFCLARLECGPNLSCQQGPARKVCRSMQATRRSRKAHLAHAVHAGATAAAFLLTQR